MMSTHEGRLPEIVRKNLTQRMIEKERGNEARDEALKVAEEIGAFLASLANNEGDLAVGSHTTRGISSAGLTPRRQPVAPAPLPPAVMAGGHAAPRPDGAVPNGS
jgi:hypothetical protein